MPWRLPVNGPASAVKRQLSTTTMATRNVNKSAHQRVVPLPLEQLSKLHCTYRDLCQTRRQWEGARGKGGRWKIEAIPFYSICAVMQIMCESVQTSKGLPVKKWPTYEFLRQLGKRAAELMVGWLAKTHASGNCLTKAGTVTYTQLHRHATLVYVLTRPSLCQVSVCIK